MTKNNLDTLKVPPPPPGPEPRDVTGRTKASPAPVVYSTPEGRFSFANDAAVIADALAQEQIEERKQREALRENYRKAHPQGQAILNLQSHDLFEPIDFTPDEYRRRNILAVAVIDLGHSVCRMCGKQDDALYANWCPAKRKR